MPAIHGILVVINSKRDANGNTYWAFTYTDTATGAIVRATAASGPSNSELVRFGWTAKDKFDQGIVVHGQQMQVRQFNALTHDWPHAGCDHEDIRRFIRAEIQRQAAGGAK